MAINRPNVFSAGAATNTDLYLDAASGKLGESARVISWSGRNPDVDNLPEYLTFNGLQRSPTSTTYYDGISSSSANDAEAGIGAQKLFIEGIDDDGDLASEVVTLNGISLVSFANNYYVINRCSVIEAGNVGSNLGNLLLREGLSGRQNGQVLAGGISQLNQAGYPRGFFPILQNVRIRVSRDSTTTTAGDMQVHLYHAQNMEGDVVYGKIRTYDVPLGSLAAGVYEISEELILPTHVLTKQIQGTEFTNVPTSGYFYFQADGDASGMNVIVSAGADLLYRDVRA